MATKIPWTDETWNPVVGCSKVSEGCQNCYAERMMYRQVVMGATRHEKNPDSSEDAWIAYSGVMDEDTHKWNGSVSLRPEILDQPLHWKKPRMIFVSSMGDLFHPSVPFEFIDKVRQVMRQCPQHTFQILTKRLIRLYEYCEVKQRGTWPENIWLGVTAENQRCADERALINQIPAAITFMSHEPLLSYIDMQGKMPSWGIIGAESGPKRRECRLEWVYDLVKQYKDANRPVFVKQLSINGRVSKNMSEWPEDLRLREYPK